MPCLEGRESVQVESTNGVAILQPSLVAMWQIAFAAEHCLLYCWSCQYITVVYMGVIVAAVLNLLPSAQGARAYDQPCNAHASAGKWLKLLQSQHQGPMLPLVCPATRHWTSPPPAASVTEINYGWVFSSQQQKFSAMRLIAGANSATTNIPLHMEANSSTHARVGISVNALRRLDEAIASEVEGLSLSRMETQRYVIHFLADMLQAIAPMNFLAVRDQLLVDLIDPYRFNQTKLLQLLTTTMKDRLPALGLELNKAVQCAFANPETTRFVLATSPGCMLPHALLHLVGGDREQKGDLKIPEVEVITGPLNQGLVLAESQLAVQFHKPDPKIADHYTYVIMEIGCQLEGVSIVIVMLVEDYLLLQSKPFSGKTTRTSQSLESSITPESTGEKQREYTNDLCGKCSIAETPSSACLANTPEGNKRSQQRRGCDARHRVTLRLLTTWFDIPWVKMEAIETMIAPTLDTLIPVIGASGFTVAASAAGTVVGTVAIATSFGAAGAGLTGSQMALE